MMSETPSDLNGPEPSDERSRVGERRLRLVLSYDGTELFGWQFQPQGPSVQSHLADAFERITGVRSVAIGSGRTDAGVHALAQVAHVDTPSRIPVSTFRRALNHFLPRSIVVREMEDVPPTFHARKDAVSKLYRYVLHDGPVDDVFLARYCWKVRYSLDETRMALAARDLLGTQDFRCFETDWPNRKTSVRTVFTSRVARLGELVTFEIAADGFLYNMVRTIVGTLYEIGREKWPVGRLEQIVQSQDRASAGLTAPARGLFLVRVDYPP